MAVIGIAALAASVPAPLNAQPKPQSAAATGAVSIDADDIGGTVRGPKGPEAGVWVIAETTDLPTRYTKSVVTDDQGRYVIPDLPTANYQVWVRGYGLVDSPKMRAKPGQKLDLTAVAAPSPAAAAHYYPAIYWYTMMKLPPAKDFGGHTDIPKNITRENWIRQMNNTDCIGCHQLGQEATRTIPAQFGKFNSGAEAWQRRITSGQSGEMMTNRIAGQFGGVPYKYFGDWTDRVAKGELPKNKPPRPSGVERNLVVTTWDWSTPDKYLHDLIASDRRNPTVNANGPLYGSPEYATDNMPVLDPKTNKVSYLQDAGGRSGHAGFARTGPRRRDQADGAVGLLGRRGSLGHQGQQPQRHVRRQGPGLARRDRARHGQSGLVQEGLGATVRQGLPDRQESAPGGGARSQDQGLQVHRHLLRHPSSAVRLRRRQHAVDVAAPARWPAGSTPRCSTRPATRRRRRAGSRSCSTPTATASSTNSGDKPEEGKDTRYNPGSGPYAVMPHPTDGSVWYTSGVFGGTPGFLRFDPKTKLSEFYALPKEAISLRGGDIGKDGVL